MPNESCEDIFKIAYCMINIYNSPDIKFNIFYVQSYNSCKSLSTLYFQWNCPEQSMGSGHFRKMGMTTHVYVHGC